MSTKLLCDVAERIKQALFFSVMVDECVDSSNKEQLVLCFRYVDNEMVTHEDFVGLYECPNITANTIVSAIEDVMLRLNLNITRCRGQCYDGGSNMAGSKNGVKQQILRKEPRALFIHCYGHVLSLSVADTIINKNIPLLRSNMDTLFEISKLLQYSPKRMSLFKDVKAETSPDAAGFRILCPTRWTVRNETFRSIIDNYSSLMEVWEEILSGRVDSEVRARVNGVASQMNTFEFFLGVHLLYIILRHTDNLSKTLQMTKMSAAEGQKLADMTVTALQVGIYVLATYLALFVTCTLRVQYYI